MPSSCLESPVPKLPQALEVLLLSGNRFSGPLISGAFDGLVYALLTAGVFAAFWPEGADLAEDGREKREGEGEPDDGTGDQSFADIALRQQVNQTGAQWLNSSILGDRSTNAGETHSSFQPQFFKISISTSSIM